MVSDAIEDAAIVVGKTRSSEQAFCSPLRGSLWPVRPESRCEAHSVEVVARDIFATPKLFEITCWAKAQIPI
jgi:hypothetical protein